MATSIVMTAEDGTVDIDIGGTAGVSGTPQLVGSIVVVPKATIAANAVGAVYVTGVVVRFTKTTADSITAGDIAYWDNGATEFTTTSTGNTACGYFLRDKTGAGTADVWLSQ